MKKMSIIFAALVLLAAASCTKVEMLESQHDLEPLSIYSGEKPSQSPALKTSLNGTSVIWTADDKVAVFDKLNNVNEFRAASVNGSKARFEGLVETGTTDFYAVYPYECAVSADASAMYLQLPVDQTPSAGTFAEELNVSVAKGVKTFGETEVSGLKFNNICGLVYFTVPEHLAAISQVVFTAENRNLAGQLTVSKSSVPSVTSIANGSQSVTMNGSFKTGSTFYFVVAPGRVEGFNIRVKAANGAAFTMSSTASFELAAGGMKNLGTINFKPEFSADANHVYSNGVLTGTQVNVSFGIPAGMEDYVESVEVKVLNVSGTVVRQFNSDAAIPNVTLGKAHGKAYLPQGKYQVLYTYVMNGVSKTEKRDITVPAPVFTGTVSVSGVTSYSLSKTDVNAANAYTEDRIGDIVLNCITDNGISSDVLREFPLSYSVLLDGSSEILSGTSNSQNDIKAGEKKNIAWGQHTLKAKVSFDGQTIEGTSAPLYVTGLPYSVSFAGLTSAPAGWNLYGGISWTGYGWNDGDGANYLRLKGGKSYNVRGRALSPAFYLPASINATVTTDCYYYRSSGSSKSVYVNANSSACPELTTNETTLAGGVTFNNFNSIGDLVNSVTLTSASPHISITHSVTVPTLGTAFIGVQTVMVTYR